MRICIKMLEFTSKGKKKKKVQKSERGKARGNSLSLSQLYITYTAVYNPT